jgi:hypothetical protein
VDVSLCEVLVGDRHKVRKRPSGRPSQPPTHALVQGQGLLESGSAVYVLHKSLPHPCNSFQKSFRAATHSLRVVSQGHV